MTNSGTQQLNTTPTSDGSVIGLFFDSRLHLINAFVILIPFWSVIMISDILVRTQPRSRYLLRNFNQILLIGLPVNVAYNTYYFCTKGVQTFHGRMHLVAALCCLIFIMYLFINFRPTADVGYGLMISYLGISLSLFTLPLEYIFEKNEILPLVFFLGLAVYFLGLIMTAACVTATRFM